MYNNLINNITMMSATIFEIPKRPEFLDDSFSLHLTGESIELFNLGKPGQSYAGIVNLETGEVHLYPSFNKNDGLVKEDIHGQGFLNTAGEPRFCLSRDALGSAAGDLHTKTAADLGLMSHAGSRGLIMGFGIWKSGCGVRLLSAESKLAGTIPDEYVLVKNLGWSLRYYDDNRQKTIIPLSELPELEHICKQHQHKTIDEINADLALRHLIESELRKYHHHRFGEQSDSGIKYAKNRSGSQNNHSFKIVNTYFEAWFNVMNAGHTLHERDLLRELPLAVFEKIMRTVCQGLGIPPIDNMLTSPIIPIAIDGIREHFHLAVQWQTKIAPAINEALRRLDMDGILTEETYELIVRLREAHDSAATALINLHQHDLMTDKNIQLLSNRNIKSYSENLISMVNILILFHTSHLTDYPYLYRVMGKLDDNGRLYALSNMMIRLNSLNIKLTDNIFLKFSEIIINNQEVMSGLGRSLLLLGNEPFSHLSMDEVNTTFLILLEETDNPLLMMQKIQLNIQENNRLIKIFQSTIHAGSYQIKLIDDLLMPKEKQDVCAHFIAYFMKHRHEDCHNIIEDWAITYHMQYATNPFTTINASPHSNFSFFASSNHFAAAFRSLVDPAKISDLLAAIMLGEVMPSIGNTFNAS